MSSKGSSSDDSSSIERLGSLVQQVKQNFQTVCKEWGSFKDLMAKTQVNEDMVQVSKTDLTRMEKEVKQLRQFLPKVLHRDYLGTFTSLGSIQQDLMNTKKDLETSTLEQQHWQSRCQTALSDLDSSQQEKFGMKCEVEQLSRQLSQQSEFCAQMGAATCTLLWRVSRCEESIQAILGGSQVDEFITLTLTTLNSYVATYQQEAPQESENETMFILALCGIFTNIAATPFGRDVLISNTNGKQMVDVFLTVLAEAPNKFCAKMKNLILMFLYNLSINQKGLQYILTRPGVLQLLAWLLQEQSDPENCVNTLRLLQSLLYEQQDSTLVQEAVDLLRQADLLLKLTSDPCPEVREAAKELSADLHLLMGDP